MKLFIAYYYNGEDQQDAELYVGKNGSNEEFIAYWKMAYLQEMSEEDINGIYPVKSEMDIRGKMHNIHLSTTVANRK